MDTYLEHSDQVNKNDIIAYFKEACVWFSHRTTRILPTVLDETAAATQIMLGVELAPRTYGTSLVISLFGVNNAIESANNFKNNTDDSVGPLRNAFQALMGNNYGTATYDVIDIMISLKGLAHKNKSINHDDIGSALSDQLAKGSTLYKAGSMQFDTIEKLKTSTGRISLLHEINSDIMNGMDMKNALKDEYSHASTPSLQEEQKK